MEIVLPVPFVLGAIDVDVDTIAICLVVFPLALIDVAISMPELSASIGFVKAPLTLVFGAVGPDLNSWTVSLVVKKVTFEDSY